MPTFSDALSSSEPIPRAVLRDALEVVARAAAARLRQLAIDVQGDETLRNEVFEGIDQRSAEYVDADPDSSQLERRFIGAEPDVQAEIGRWAGRLEESGAAALRVTQWSIEDGRGGRDSDEDYYGCGTPTEEILARLEQGPEDSSASITVALRFNTSPSMLDTGYYFPPETYQMTVKIERNPYNWDVSIDADSTTGPALRAELRRLLDPHLVPYPDYAAEAAGDFTIFLGHGRHADWLILEREMRKAGFTVDEFDGVPRAGETIQGVLEEMLVRHDVGVFLLAPEDRVADEAVRGRQNVVHEIGLFQGRHGWYSAIVVWQRAVEVPSNLQGVIGLAYDKSPAEIIGELTLALNKRKLERGGQF